MKLVTAILEPAKLESAKEALQEAGISRLTVSDVQGFGRQKGHAEIYRGQEYTVTFLRRVKLEVAVDDKEVDAAVRAIVKAARSGREGKIGDGKIFVAPLDDAVRIRTGERGAEAL